MLGNLQNKLKIPSKGLRNGSLLVSPIKPTFLIKIGFFSKSGIIFNEIKSEKSSSDNPSLYAQI